MVETGPAARQRAPPPRPKPVENTWNRPQVRSKPSASEAKLLPFGAWYLPPEAWGKPAPPHDGEAAVTIAHVRDPSLIQSKGDSASDADASGITSKLGPLYSSRMYKDYLRSHGARVPEYLLRVETPKPGQKRQAAAGVA
jgi:hypothetical protein